MTIGDVVVFTLKTNPDTCGSLGVVRRINEVGGAIDVDWLLPTPPVAQMMAGTLRDWAERNWRCDAFEVIGHV